MIYVAYFFKKCFTKNEKKGAGDDFTPADTMSKHFLNFKNQKKGWK